jgi:hypothetical protein
MTAQLVNLRLAYGPKSKIASVEDLALAPMPERTDSYVPIRHDEVVNMVKSDMEKAGLNIVQESHVLWRNGLRYFGLMQVNHPELNNADQAMVVGLRSSYDKSLPLTILSGGQIFLCDNLSFNGETVLGRKHTTFILDDLPSLIGKAMQTLFNNWKKHFARIEAYKSYDLGDLEAHDLIVKAYRLGAIAKTQVAEAIDVWHKPPHPEFKDRNLWGFHNALTEIWKGRLDLLPMNSKIVHSELDKVVGFNYTEPVSAQ